MRISCSGILFAITHLARYEGAHYWYFQPLRYYGRYTGEGLWGCISGVIGAILGIAAGKSSDYRTFRSLYISQSVFVSDDKYLNIITLTRHDLNKILDRLQYCYIILCFFQNGLRLCCILDR